MAHWTFATSSSMLLTTALLPMLAFTCGECAKSVSGRSRAAPLARSGWWSGQQV